ncbi:MAG: PepSY-associated TM helix domain-containing protein [Wenzhouxiangella sp.]
MTRRNWFNLHSWAGLKLSVFMFFISITGTLAVFAHDIDWLLNEKIRVSVGDERASHGAMIDAARASYPDWTFFILYEPVERWFAAELIAFTPDGELRRIYIDPYRAEVTGDAGWLNAHRILRETHRNLMLPTKIGVPLVSLLAIPLLISAVTSLKIYKRWWTGFFQRPRTQRKRRFWGDVHRLTGVWSLAFIFIIAVTSVWYLVESLGAHAPPAASMPSGNPDLPPPQVDGAALDEMIANARQDFPELVVTRIMFPRRAEQPLVLQGQTDAWLVRPRANAIAFEPGSGVEVHRHRAGELNLHQRISEAADPLHFGYFGGLATRILWFVFGLGMSALSLTGIYLFGLRVVGKSSSPRRAVAV